VDSITLIGLPLAVLLLALLLECELHPENTRHAAAAAATGATSLSFMTSSDGADGGCDVHYLHHLDGKLSVIQHLSIVGCLVCFRQADESQTLADASDAVAR
jgi:hypothetical protein